MAKSTYNWNKVEAGDIISFRYRGKKAKSALLTTILVLNPNLRNITSDGKTTIHLVGLKLESVGVRPMVRDGNALSLLLSKLGEIQKVDLENEIYRVSIKGANAKGAPQNTYQKIKQQVSKFNLYRTYDYNEAKKSQVFLEPIKLPKKLVESL
tara:strand:- start:822 stop:1280 length:459 start_codon:yes stop_codon:yes gene_type:complete